MYANCLIMALLQKIKDPRTKLYFIRPKINPGGHCHTMWKNQWGQNFHFTCDGSLHGMRILLFKGFVEELKPGTIEQFKGIRFL
jgi:hypothetical protein